MARPQNTGDFSGQAHSELGRTNLSAGRRPLVSLYEGWQDELGIDNSLWTVTDPATGAAWARGAVNDLLMAYVAPNASENARIRSNQRWVAAPENYGVNRILQRFNLEFVAQFVNVANFDNTGFFMGLTTGIADTRATNNVIGWRLNGAGNALYAFVDDAGVEDQVVAWGETLTDINKFKIEIFEGHMSFYLNERLGGGFNFRVTAMPNFPFYLNFYFPTTAGGAATARLGSIRAWLEDE